MPRVPFFSKLHVPGVPKMSNFLSLFVTSSKSADFPKRCSRQSGSTVWAMLSSPKVAILCSQMHMKIKACFKANRHLHAPPRPPHNPTWDVVTRRAGRHIFNGKVKAGSSKPHHFFWTSHCAECLESDILD